MKNKHIPLRRCMGCNISKEKNDLIRIVKNKKNIVEIDNTGKMLGRGAYICKDEKCLKNVIKTKRFERTLKVQIPDSFYESLEKLIKN